MKKAFTTETTAAAELFNAPPPAPKKKVAANPAKIEPTPTAPTIAPPPPPPIQQIPADPNTGVFSWKARPDGERRDRRMQITCKPSITAKAATLAREKGISVNYLFELLISAEWKKAHPED